MACLLQAAFLKPPACVATRPIFTMRLTKMPGVTMASGSMLPSSAISCTVATVFFAEDERLGRRVAIKRLHADASEETAPRFRREMRLAAAEKKAAALPAQLTVPMILFFLPVLFVVILGPAILQIMDRWHLRKKAQP